MFALCLDWWTDRRRAISIRVKGDEAGKCNSSVTQFPMVYRKERIERTAQNICRFIHYIGKTRGRQWERERVYKIERIPTTTITVTKDSYRVYSWISLSPVVSSRVSFPPIPEKIQMKHIHQSFGPETRRRSSRERQTFNFIKSILILNIRDTTKDG